MKFCWLVWITRGSWKNIIMVCKFTEVGGRTTTLNCDGWMARERKLPSAPFVRSRVKLRGLYTHSPVCIVLCSHYTIPMKFIVVIPSRLKEWGQMQQAQLILLINLYQLSPVNAFYFYWIFHIHITTITHLFSFLSLSSSLGINTIKKYMISVIYIKKTIHSIFILNFWKHDDYN